MYKDARVNLVVMIYLNLDWRGGLLWFFFLIFWIILRCRCEKRIYSIRTVINWIWKYLLGSTACFHPYTRFIPILKAFKDRVAVVFIGKYIFVSYISIYNLIRKNYAFTFNVSYTMYVANINCSKYVILIYVDCYVGRGCSKTNPLYTRSEKFQRNFK